MAYRLKIVVCIIAVVLASGCKKDPQESFLGSGPPPRVTVYVAHDQVYSEPILKGLEEERLEVIAAYDTESTKTVGLVNRLIAEKNNPQADLFWNNEIAHTIALKKKGILRKISSDNARDIPATFKDPEGYWIGFGARARVIIYNTELVKPEDAPTSIYDLADPKWKGKAGIANPLFGTTSTHVAALFSALGEEKAKEYLQSLKANDIQILDGNSVVRDRVGKGSILVGLTDTDDAVSGMRNGLPIAIVFPDQETIGTLLIPNTLCRLAGRSDAKKVGNVQKVVDGILSHATEKALAASPAAQIPLHPDVGMPEDVAYFATSKAMQVNFNDVAAKIEASAKYVQEVFIR